jgi:hypothetical protein
LPALGIDLSDVSGTLEVEVGGAAFAGVGVRGDIGVAIDTQGNVAIVLGAGGGDYAAVGVNRIGPFVGVTNAPLVSALVGRSV